MTNRRHNRVGSPDATHTTFGEPRPGEESETDRDHCGELDRIPDQQYHDQVEPARPPSSITVVVMLAANK